MLARKACVAEFDHCGTSANARALDRSGRAASEQLAAFGGYSAGRNFLPFPDGAGVLLRANAKLQFQTHYTPNGKGVRDVTHVGYYLHKAAPKYEMRKRFQ